MGIFLGDFTTLGSGSSMLKTFGKGDIVLWNNWIKDILITRKQWKPLEGKETHSHDQRRLEDLNQLVISRVQLQLMDNIYFLVIDYQNYTLMKMQEDVRHCTLMKRMVYRINES